MAIERWTEEVHLARYFALIGELREERAAAPLISA